MAVKENEITGDILLKEGFLRFVNNYSDPTPYASARDNCHAPNFQNDLCASAALRENSPPQDMRTE